MIKRFLALIAVFLLAANLSAGDPWKDKPYKQWDEKDLRKILTDSPWSKLVQIESTWEGTKPSATASPLGAGGTAASGEPKDIIRGAKPAGPPSGLAGFLIRWGSSRTVRRALARGAILKGAQEAEIEKALNLELPDYLVVVLGPDMTPFEKAGEKELKEMQEKSHVSLQKSKAKIAPSRIVIERSPDGKRIMALYISFPKKTPAGQPSILADEKGAEFVCQLGTIAWKTRIDLHKMANSEGMDL